jgi:hypothetical protein
MNRKVFVIAVLLVLSSLILSLIPISPQLNEMYGRWSYLGLEKATGVNTSRPSSQAHDVSDNSGPDDDATNLQSKSQETAKNGMRLEQSDSQLFQDRVENNVGTVNESVQIPCEGIVEKPENNTLPGRLDTVLPPSEFERIQFTQP